MALVLTRKSGQANLFFIDGELIGREVVTIERGKIKTQYEFDPAIRIVRDECKQGDDGKGKEGRTAT